MDTVAVTGSPCDLHPSRATAPSGDASLKEATLVCWAAASTCRVCPSQSASAASTGTTTAAAAAAAAVAPAWLSVALTCSMEVVVQVSPGATAGVPAVRLAECRGVKTRSAQPHFCRLACRNAAELCALHGGLVALPLSPADVVAADVCACSAGVRAVLVTPDAAAQSTRRDEARSSAGAGSAASPVAGASAPTRTGAARASDSATVAELTRVARSLPSIALVLRFSQRCRRALLLLRPAVVVYRRKHALAYRSSLHLLSESVQRVALSPYGDAVLVLADAFLRDTESGGGEAVAGVAPAKDADKEATLLLHGGYLRLDSDGAETAEQHAIVLRPLVLHLGLRGASARSTTLRALLRCRATGAWCRPAVGATGGGVEVVLHTSEGHVLVFERASLPTSRGSSEEAAAAAAAAPVLYTCGVGGRLSFAASAETTAGRGGSADAAADALVVAPPWRFADRWRHSPWLTRALSPPGGTARTPSPVAHLADAEARPHRHRRHRRPTPVAVSANRRVWLLRAGDVLYVASVPSSSSGRNGGGPHGGTLPLLTAAVHLEPAYALHDALYLDCGGHAGFLLLCRHTGVADATGADHAASAGGGSMLHRWAGGGRFVHATPRGPVRLFFLSLLLVPGGAASTALLLPLPVQPASALVADALPPSFTHPSSRLRLVCAAAVADAVDTALVGLGSSGAAGVAWVGAVRVPCVWTWCVSRRLDGAAAGAAAVRQWATHVFSALFPHAALVACDAAVALSPDAADGQTTAADLLLEGALLALNYPYAHDAPLGAEDDHHGGAAVHYSRGAIAFHEALHGLLHAGDASTGARTHPAGTAAVFAGFADALRMSGVLRGDDAGPAAAATMGVVALLHGCAQPLRHALEDVAAAGDVSALLTCASHLAGTAAAAGAAAVVERPPAVATALVVWRRLLHPLFDFVWGVVQAYGIAAEVAGDVLAYCSPAVRSMANARRVYWLGGRSTAHTQRGAAAEASPPPAELAVRIAAGARDANGSPAPAKAAESAGPSPASQAGPPPSTTSSSAAPYTSAELYEVVRRVFLMQGATAAVQLVAELQKHERTRAGVAEMAHLFEAMQQRLQQAAA